MSGSPFCQFPYYRIRGVLTADPASWRAAAINNRPPVTFPRTLSPLGWIEQQSFLLSEAGRHSDAATGTGAVLKAEKCIS